MRKSNENETEGEKEKREQEEKRKQTQEKQKEKKEQSVKKKKKKSEDPIRAAYETIKRGISAPSNNLSLEGSTSRTSEAIRPARETQDMKNYQLHAYDMVMNNIKGGVQGMLLAYEMGPGKTLIAVGAVNVCLP
jgi:phenylalanyl-tRNA synthetase alpha subunit